MIAVFVMVKYYGDQVRTNHELGRPLPACDKILHSKNQ